MSFTAQLGKVSDTAKRACGQRHADNAADARGRCPAHRGAHAAHGSDSGQLHFPDKEAVLTPWRVVNMHMTDTLGGYDFFDARHAAELPTPRFVSQGTVTEQTLRAADTRLLEVNSKSGVYPLWLAYTLWRLRRTDGMTPAAEWQLWQHILSRNLYVVCKTRMAEKITRRMLLGFHQAEANTATFDGLALLLKDEHKRKALIRKIKSPKTYNPNTTENQMLTYNTPEISDTRIC